MTSKEILFADKETFAWWNSVINHPLYPKIVLLARADTANWDDIRKIEGARDLLDMLEGFAANPPEQRQPLTAGLKHDFNQK